MKVRGLQYLLRPIGLVVAGGILLGIEYGDPLTEWTWNGIPVVYPAWTFVAIGVIWLGVAVAGAMKSMKESAED